MSRLSDMNPILKSKLNVREKFNSIVEEKCLILECIEDMISKAESAVEDILNENDRLKFLAAYRSVNRYLESCSEKLLEIRIILFDKEESDSGTCFSVKTSPSLVSIDDIRSVRNESNPLSDIPSRSNPLSNLHISVRNENNPLSDIHSNVRSESNPLLNLGSKTPEANIRLISQTYPVSNINERNTKISDLTEVTDVVVEDKHLSSQDKLYKPSTSLHRTKNASIDKDNSAKFHSQVYNCFSPTSSSYHSFSSLSSSHYTPNKDDPQPLDLCCQLTRPQPVYKTDANSLVNTGHSKTNATPPKCPSFENIKKVISRHKVDSASLVNAGSDRGNISSPCQESSSSDDSSLLKHKMNDSSLVHTNCSRTDTSPSTHSGKNFPPVASRHEIDGKIVCSRTDATLECQQSSSSDEDFKTAISRNETDSKSLVGTTCSRTDRKQQNLCSDEDAKDQSLISDSDERQDLQFCLKRKSPKIVSSASPTAHKTNCVIPPYQIAVAVNVTFVENPSSFWLQPNKEQFQELLDHLQSVQLKDVPSCFTKGRHYLAPYGSDDDLHRVKLIEEPSTDGLVLVHYIDYGNRESIPATSLKSISPQVNAFPVQAVHCHLIGAKSGEKETYSFAKLFEESSVSVSAFAIFSPPKSEKYPVQLFIESLTSGYRLDVAKHISKHQTESSESPVEVTKHSCKHLRESSTSPFEVNSRKETFHHPQRSVAENNSGNDDEPFDLTVKQKVKVEEKSVNTNDDETLEGKKDFHSKGASAFPISWSEKEKINSETESWSSSSNSSSIKSLENKNARSFDDGDRDVEVPEPEIVLLQNNSVPVMVSVIINPKEFYVHIVSEKSCDLDNLSEQLNSYYNHPCKWTSVKLKVGKYCACPFSSSQEWYRVVILEILEDAKSKNLQSKNTLDVIVQYIDYGNKECVSSKDLRPLPQFLACYPAFAVRCALAHLQPPLEELTSSLASHWPKKTIARFKELTGFEKCFTAQFLSPSDIRVEPEVILWNSDETSVNDILIQEGLASKDFTNDEFESERSNSDVGSIDGLGKGWNPMADDFLNEQNLYEVDLDDPEIAFTGYKAKEDKYICKFVDRGERCHRGERCPYKHIRREDVKKLDKEEVFSYDLSIELPTVGTCVLVQVSAVFNPLHFYVIFPYGTIPVDDTNILAYPVKEDVDKFVKNMSSYYNTTKVKKNTTVHALGKIVAAKSRADNQWYRARVQDTAEKLTKVFYVDFGNCEWVPHYDLEEIDSRFMDFPFQAVECRLANVQMKKTVDSVMKTTFWELFQHLTENQILLADVVGLDQSVLLVKLYCITENSDISVNDELIVRGLAIPED